MNSETCVFGGKYEQFSIGIDLRYNDDELTEAFKRELKQHRADKVPNPKRGKDKYRKYRKRLRELIVLRLYNTYSKDMKSSEAENRTMEFVAENWDKPFYPDLRRLSPAIRSAQKKISLFY